MRIELPIPSSIPLAKIAGFVQKRSSPTSSTLVPSSSVSAFQPDQSFSAMPSSSSTMGYCPTHEDHRVTISSGVFFDLSDLKNRYLPSSHISEVAGSRQIEGIGESGTGPDKSGTILGKAGQSGTGQLG